jgi:hypothetical protein
MSPLATLAALTDQLGDCPRAGRPCDCVICAADAVIERGFRPLFAAAVLAVDDSCRWRPGAGEQR